MIATHNNVFVSISYAVQLANFLRCSTSQAYNAFKAVNAETNRTVVTHIAFYIPKSASAAELYDSWSRNFSFAGGSPRCPNFLNHV